MFLLWCYFSLWLRGDPNLLICCCSVTKLYPVLCNPMNYNTPGFFVFHYLPEFAQTHVYWVSDAFQPPHPLSTLSSCPQSSPASGSIPTGKLFESGDQSIGASASEPVLPMNIQDWFPLVLTGLIFFSPRDSQESSPTPQFKSINSLVLSLLFVQLSHPHMTTGKNIALTRAAFVGKVKSLLFNMLSRFVIAFLPRSKHLLILWLQSPSTLILEPKKI